MKIDSQTEVGEIVQALRTKSGLTKNKLALKAGVSHPTIVQVEAGGRRLSLDTAVRIFDALGYELMFERKVGNEEK